MPKVIKDAVKSAKPSKNGASKKSSNTAKAGNREVLYAEIECKILQGEEALTAEQAKILLGWEYTEADTKKKVYQYKDAEGNDLERFTDRDGKEYVINNNLSNRPFDYKWCEVLMTEHLKRRYHGLNGQNLVIGKTGITISCQHRLVSLVWAAQEYAKEPEKYPEWDSEPTMECSIFYGCDESDEVVNTIDTGKIRNLTEVIYRSAYFDDMGKGDRINCASIASSALKQLVKRTGFRDEVAISNRIHSESLAWLDNHENLLKYVREIYQLDEDGQISSQYLSEGYATMICYLMAVSATDPKKYQSAEIRSEELLDFEHEEKAMDFFTKLSEDKALRKNKKFEGLKEAYDQLIEDETDAWDYKIAVVANAWLNCWLKRKPITKDVIMLKFNVDDEGGKSPADNPTFGGIDLGMSGYEDESDDPTPSQIRALKAKERAAKERRKNPPKLKLKQQVWAEDEGGHIVGKVQEVYDGPNGKVVKIITAKGKQWEYPIEVISITDPNDTEDDTNGEIVDEEPEEVEEQEEVEVGEEEE